MSERDPFLDRHTGIDEILESIEANTRTLVAAQGVAETDSPNHTVFTPYEYAALPDTIHPYGFPAGTTVFDFANGEVSHSDTIYPNAGTFLTGIRTFADMTRDLPGAELQGLRSVFLETDAPVSVNLDGAASNGWLDIAAGARQVIRSLGFTQLRVKSDYNYRIRLGVSTRVDAFDSVNVETSAIRKGYHDETTSDGWERVNFWPVGMDNTLADVSVDHTDYWQDELPFGGYSKAGIILENDSAAANSIDARIVARDDWAGGSSANPTWYQIGDSINEATSGYLAQGDHYHWEVDVPHYQLAVEVTNETNGDAYTVNADVSLGGK